VELYGVIRLLLEGVALVACTKVTELEREFLQMHVAEELSLLLQLLDLLAQQLRADLSGLVARAQLLLEQLVLTLEGRNLLLQVLD